MSRIKMNARGGLTFSLTRFPPQVLQFLGMLNSEPFQPCPFGPIFDPHELLCVNICSDRVDVNSHVMGWTAAVYFEFRPAPAWRMMGYQIYAAASFDVLVGFFQANSSDMN